MSASPSRDGFGEKEEGSVEPTAIGEPRKGEHKKLKQAGDGGKKATGRGRKHRACGQGSEQAAKGSEPVAKGTSLHQGNKPAPRERVADKGTRTAGRGQWEQGPSREWKRRAALIYRACG